MTVARIRELPGADSVEVTFLESARYYLLSKAHPEFGKIFRKLQDAFDHRRLLKVRYRSPDSDVIEDVHDP